MHDAINLLLAMIQHYQIGADQLQHIGKTEPRRFAIGMAQARLDEPRRFEAEIPEEAAAERRQARALWYAKLILQQRKLCKWIFGLGDCRQPPVAVEAHNAFVQFHTLPAGQAYHRAGFHEGPFMPLTSLEQIILSAVGQCLIKRKRLHTCWQRHMLPQWDMAITGVTVGEKTFRTQHACVSVQKRNN